MNKKISSTFILIAILSTTVFVVGAYTNPSTNQFTSAGIPITNTAYPPVSTRGVSQTKEKGLALMSTFQARGNAEFQDHVFIEGPLFGGAETATLNRTLRAGIVGDTTPTSVFTQKDVKTVDFLQTKEAAVLAGGGTVPVCSDSEGYVVLCGETPPIIPPPSSLPAVTAIRAQMVSGTGPSRVACYITLASPVSVQTNFTYRFNTGSSNAPYTEKVFNCTIAVPAGATAYMSETANTEFAGRYIFGPSTCVQSFPQTIVSVPQVMRCI